MGKKRNRAFELQDVIYELLNCIDELEIDTDIDASEVYTFNDVGVLTNEAGLVITLHNGEQYQLTIVRRQ